MDHQTDHSAEIDPTAIKTLIRDLGDMACIGCRAKTCPACSLAAEITNEVHLLARREPVLPPGESA